MEQRTVAGPYRPRLGARSPLGVAPAPAPPPSPDPLFTGYEGALGIVETVAVLGVAGAASWVGIRTALAAGQNDLLKAAGWIGGVGSGLLGLLYLAGKSGLSSQIGIPAVRVSPT